MFCQWIPRPVVRMLAQMLAALAFSVLRIRRRITVENIHRALSLPRADSVVLARKVYYHMCLGALEFLRLGRLDATRARAILGAEGRRRLSELRSQGRGVLVLTAHLGSWDLLACCTAMAGFPINVVTRRIKAGWIDGFWMEQRRACGVRLLQDSGSGTSILRALRANELVAMVLDQHQPGGPELPFFGRPAATSAGLARLASSLDCPVVPAFLLRVGQEGYELALGEPLKLQRSANTRADVLENTKLFLNVLEGAVRRNPEQWLWLHRRWKVPRGDEAPASIKKK